MTQSLFEAAVSAFDLANAEDPNTEIFEGRDYPRALRYGQRMSAMLARFSPDATDAVRLAVRAQHIQRWKTPRNSYPPGKPGYMLWRTGLYRFHAETAGDLMRAAGYDEAMIARVKTIVSKSGLKNNPETQQLEDVACLVFFEHAMSDFVAQHADYDEAKWLQIIKKTWGKMSPGAQTFALSGQVKLPEALLPLIMKAVR